MTKSVFFKQNSKQKSVNYKGEVRFYELKAAIHCGANMIKSCSAPRHNNYPKAAWQ